MPHENHNQAGDDPRAQNRNDDRSDGTDRQDETPGAGELSRTADAGVEHGRQRDETGDETGTGVAAAITYSRSAPLPTVEEYAGYERVLPGAADRILTMAEKALDIEAADRAADRGNEAEDHKAENACMLVASFAFSFLPWVAFVMAGVCAIAGNNTGTFFSGG